MPRIASSGKPYYTAKYSKAFLPCYRGKWQGFALQELSPYAIALATALPSKALFGVDSEVFLGKNDYVGTICMNMVTGTIQYQLGTIPVSGCGFSYSASERDTALSGPVAEIVFDDCGKTQIEELIAGLPETDFEKGEVKRILSNSKPPEDWRVGEALAESYLTHHKNCFFPWPDGRDQRKSGSSLPGADLVGFQSTGASIVFAFAEVKTSTENKYPPGAMHGRTGLKQQLEDLKDDVKIKDNLVVYLAHRAINASWKSDYQNAAKNYIQNNTNVRIFGFLIRDVLPNQDDLRIRVTKLAKEQHLDMVIELLALYLPQNSIEQLSSNVVSSRNGGVV